MNRKFTAILAIAALVVAGASAQLMIGVSGAIPMGSTDQLDAQQIMTQLEDGNGVLYGGLVELGLGKLGLGVSANTMTYYVSDLDTTYRIYDINAYLSLHLFGAKAFLDPFGELGGGLIGTGYDSTDISSADLFIDASYYWYAAAGLGVNLGPLGVFAKFAYNFAIPEAVTSDEMPDGYPAFGTSLFGGSYLPPYRFTLGAKILL
jgi:hypothetical protein